MGYPAAASWAVRRGGTRLLLFVAAAALGLIVSAGLWLGVRHETDIPRLLSYALVLMGPVVVIPTLLLARPGRARASGHLTLGTALLGALVGLICGWLLVVYRLRVW
ncbi:MAG: hypothetical protein ACRELC_02435 [Gemmatimonadota bacterium]